MIPEAVADFCKQIPCAVGRLIKKLFGKKERIGGSKGRSLSQPPSEFCCAFGET